MFDFTPTLFDGEECPGPSCSQLRFNWISVYQVDYLEDAIGGRSFPSSKNVIVQKMVWLKARQHG